MFNTNPYAASATVEGTTYGGNKLKENGVSPATPNLLTEPRTRRPSDPVQRLPLRTRIRASTGGFLNWICDGNTNFSKGLDNTAGKNFDTELNTAITSVFGFPRLTDTSPEATVTTPADSIAAPNNSCAASLLVSATSGSDTITLDGGREFPAGHRKARAVSAAAAMSP